MAGCLELSFIVTVVLSTVYLLAGWYGYHTILQQNPCKMTFSAKATYPVVMESDSWKYQVRKISNPRSKNLNSQPVLFIPGHQGSHNQARSFASDMHNSDNFFQYFSLDFNGEPIAFHGGDIMDKAVYTNEALRFIHDLYEKNGKDVNHIILLGHSYGGMIARTAVLLTNHPKCLVQNIIMLSAPVTRPPLGPDGSLDMLFHNVNKAWYSAQYNNTCNDHAISSSKKVTLNINCPNKCAKNIRILSISGGDIDLQVSTELTNVFEMSARPRNSTTLPSKTGRVYTLSKYFQIKDFLKYQFSGLTSLVVNLFSAGTNGTSVSSSVNGTDSITESIKVCNSTVGQTCILSNEEETTVDAPKINPNSTYAFITKENWEEFIITYQDPQHLSLRSSQLDGVGFPIDHYAILWCYQLIDVLHNTMKKLSKSTKSLPFNSPLTTNIKPVSWDKIIAFKEKDEVTNLIEEVKPLNISNLSSFVARNASDVLFRNSSHFDQKYIEEKLSEVEVWIFAFNFFRKNLSKIFTSAVVVLIFSLAGTHLRKICGKKDATSWQLTSYFGLDPYESYINNMMHRLEVKTHEILVFLGVGLAGLIAYVRMNGSEGMSNLILVLEWIPCIGSAVSVIMIFAFVIFVLRKVAFVLVAPVALLKKWIKRNTRKTKKSIYNYILKNNMLQICYLAWCFVYSNMVEFTVLAIFFTLFVISRKTGSAMIGSSNTLFAVGSITFYSSFMILLVYLTLFEVKIRSKRGEDLQDDDDDTVTPGKRKYQYVSTQMIVLYWLAGVCGFSSAFFSFRLLFTLQPSHLDQSELFHVFGPERLNYCLAIFGAFLHIRQFFKLGPEMFEVSPIKYLQNTTNISKSNHKLKDVKCFHEDGGPNAILEQCDYSDELVLVCGDKIVVGPTYKVIFCDCAKNKALKSFDEWCEYCRCEKCGGKNIVFGNDGRPASGPQFTLHLDLIVWLGLLVVLYYLLANHDHQIYKAFLATGIVSGIFYIRTFFTNSEITFKG